MSTRDRHLAAILFTDIVGFTALMQHDETNAVCIIKHYHEVLEKSVSNHHGEILNNYGDGSLCVFNSVYEALKCAIELQIGLKSEPAVPLRVGLHLGEVLFENGQALGDDVNVASRIQSLGVANSILISSEVCHTIKNHPELTAKSLGKFDFKNVDESMEVFALANDGLVVPDKKNMEGKLQPKKSLSRKWMLAAAVLVVLLFAGYFIFSKLISDPATEKSIAVLYFDNMSGDLGQEYFSDGITEEIIAHISKIKDIRVISRTSVLSYKGKPKNLKKIAKELNVSSILEGSVRKSGNTIRITAQLIDAHTDQHIWAETYDRDLKDIFEVQSEIARMIAHKFKIEITSETNAKITQIPTQNVEAYDQYQKGMYFLYKKYFNSHQHEYFEKSKKYFETAIQLDSGYAEAYAGLAETYDELRNNSLLGVPKIEFPKGLLELKEKLARKALQLKPNSSYVNTAMAWTLVHRQGPNFDSSFFYMKNAFYIDHKDPLTNYNLSYTLTQDLGLNSPAIPLTLNAIKADPLDPNLYSILVQQYALSGKNIEAKKALQTCFELSEDPFSQVYRLPFWLVYYGDYDKAESLLKALAWGDSFQLSFLYAAKGEPGKVSQEHKNNTYILLASNRNKVMKDVIHRIEAEVERGNNTEENNYDFLSHSYYFDAYRNDPDFKRVLAKAKINHDTNMSKYGNIEIPE